MARWTGAREGYLMMPSFRMLFTAKFTEKSASLFAFFGSTV